MKMMDMRNVNESNRSLQLILRGRSLLLAASTNRRGRNKHRINTFFVLCNLQNLILFTALQDDLGRSVRSVPARLAALILQSNLLNGDDFSGFAELLDAGGSNAGELAHGHVGAAFLLDLLC